MSDTVAGCLRVGLFRALLRRHGRKIVDILSRFYQVIPYMQVSMTYIGSTSMSRATLWGNNPEERTYAVRPAPWDIKDIEADHDTNCHRPRNTRICPRPCARRRGVKRTWPEEHSGHRCLAWRPLQHHSRRSSGFESQARRVSVLADEVYEGHFMTSGGVAEPTPCADVQSTVTVGAER